MQCTFITDSLSTKPARRIPSSKRNPSRNHESRWSSCGFGPLVEPRAGGGGPRSGCCLGSGPVVWYIGRSCGPVAGCLLLFDTRVVSYVGGKSSKDESDFDKPCPYRKSIVRNQSPSNIIYHGRRPSLPPFQRIKAHNPYPSKTHGPLQLTTRPSRFPSFPLLFRQQPQICNQPHASSPKPSN